MITTHNDIISLVKAYTKDLFNYAITKVHQKEVAEDLVQDTFLSAYQSYENYKGKSNVKTWLFSILKHKIADYYRSKYKQDIEVDFDTFFDDNHRWKPEYRPKDWGNEKELLDDPKFSQTLQDCFKKLPVKWSSAVQMKYLEEHDADAICSQLEITKSNFWQITHRAKIHLRNCLEMKWFKQ
ncbi:MAG: sigma-70 family RNA polymerase sigma factor [Chitinophagaceae bacterium]|nr:sigma-70 family RNA polymerase sigma factor [Chitinophagaceae bacterium]